eukprot:3552193-Prymnesium_polylepis.1
MGVDPAHMPYAGLSQAIPPAYGQMASRRRAWTRRASASGCRGGRSTSIETILCGSTVTWPCGSGGPARTTRRPACVSRERA